MKIFNIRHSKHTITHQNKSSTMETQPQASTTWQSIYYSIKRFATYSSICTVVTKRKILTGGFSDFTDMVILGLWLREAVMTAG